MLHDVPWASLCVSVPFVGPDSSSSPSSIANESLTLPSSFFFRFCFGPSLRVAPQRSALSTRAVAIRPTLVSHPLRPAAHSPRASRGSP